MKSEVWKSPGTEASVAVELGCIILSEWVYLPTWKISKHHTVGITVPYIGMININSVSSLFFFFFKFLNIKGNMKYLSSI